MYPVGVPEKQIDAVVVGGGPAAAAVARLLALWGRHVVVVAGGVSRRPPLAESLPPSCRKPLAALGMLDAVEAAGFLPTRGNTAWWGGMESRAEPFGGEDGFQILRDRFDALLLDGARAAGARVIDGGMVRRVDLPAPGSAEPASVVWEGPRGSGTLRASWVLDGSGRVGVVARQGFRVRGSGPATNALLGVWHRDRWDLPDESHTLIESYEDGWAWSVPVGGGRRYVAAMVDPRVTSLRRGAGARALHVAELAKTTELRKLLDGATLQVEPWACAATAYGARQNGGRGFLLVGDAGSFLDPLSSFGVKKALASGWLAAVVVHTCLGDPAMEAPSLALFEERERAAQEGYAVRAGSYYAAAATHHCHPFWSVRAAAAVGTDPAANASPEAEPELDVRRLAAAFDSIRGQPSLRLRPADRLRRVSRPMVRGREVVLEEHLASPRVPNGIRYARGVELPGLVDIVAAHDQVPNLYEAYLRHRPPVRLPDFLGALSTLLALELVENAGEPQSRNGIHA